MMSAFPFEASFEPFGLEGQRTPGGGLKRAVVPRVKGQAAAPPENCPIWRSIASSQSRSPSPSFISASVSANGASRRFW